LRRLNGTVPSAYFEPLGQKQAICRGFSAISCGYSNKAALFNVGGSLGGHPSKIFYSQVDQKFAGAILIASKNFGQKMLGSLPLEFTSTVSLKHAQKAPLFTGKEAREAQKPAKQTI
jgi:hypothetical protein